MSTIKAIVKQPYCRPYVTEIENSLQSYQKLVNGRIECVGLPDSNDIDIILNEEGKLIGMAPNVYLPEYKNCAMGPVVIVGFNSRRGSHTGLSDSQISKAINYLNSNHVRSEEEFVRRFCLQR